MYKENLIFNDKFKYSININMDLHDSEKVNNFIVTNTAVNLLSKFINSIESAKGNPLLFIGPYGKGKSYLLLVLAELLYSNKFKSCKKTFSSIKKSSVYDKNVFEKIRNKRYLTITVNGSYEVFKSELILEIKKRLKEEGLDDFDYKTSYELANDLLEKWQKDEHNCKKLEKYLIKNNSSIDEIAKGLNDLDIEKLKIFKKAHVHMMFNEEFEPLIKQNITNIVIEVSNYLKEKTEFDGLLLIMDEFSKLLEGNVAAEIYADVQNLAEATANNSFRLICVAHKRIGAYISRLSIEKINEWKKIEGRFDTLFFGMFEDQSYYYRLIEKAVEKHDLDEKELKISKNIYRSFSYAYSSKEINEDLIVKGAFPLNPYTSYCLIKLSEKIAQNERSLFAFLCGEQANGLRRLVERKSSVVISVDVLYDYFSEVIKENRQIRMHSIFINAETIIKELKDKKKIKIIKVLAVFYIVNELKILQPKKEFISRALNSIDVNNEINQLVDDGLLLVKIHSNNLSFLASKNNNVQANINKIIERDYKNISFAESYKKLLNNKYIIPKRYNYKFAMTRFFKINYIDADIFCNNDFQLLSYLKNDFADGYINFIVYKTENQKKSIKDKIRDIKELTILSVVTKYEDNIFELMKNLLAINTLIANKKKYDYDKFINTELILLMSEYTKVLDNYFDNEINSIRDKSFYYMGKNIKNSKLSISKYLSRECEKIYKFTPIFNYEMINKKNISNPAKKARRYILEKIFDKEFDNTSKDTSSEKTMYRVLIKKTKFDLIEEKEFVYMEDDNDNNYIRILNEINNFFIEASKETKISELYSILERPPYGLRNGIIPIFITKYLSYHRKNIVVMENNKELKLSLNNLELINEQPNNFSIHIAKDSKEINKYLNKISKLFDNDEVYIELNIYDEVFKKVENYIKKLPICCRNLSYQFNENKCEKLDNYIMKIRDEFFKYDVNAKSLLLNKIPKKIFKGKKYNEIMYAFKEMKDIYDNYVINMKKYLINIIRIKLKLKVEIDLKKELIYWKTTIRMEQLKYIEDGFFIKIHRYIKNTMHNDELLIVEDIAYILTDIVIEDWSNYSLDMFIKNLEHITEIYNSLETIEDKPSEKNRLLLKTSNIDIERYYSKEIPTEDIISAVSEIQMLISDYAFSYKDKQTLIIDLIEKFLKGDV